MGICYHGKGKPGTAQPGAGTPAPVEQATEQTGNVFAAFPPSGLHPEGEPVITEQNGEYQYVRPMPNVDDRPIDSNDEDYKAIMRSLNIKAGVSADGTITVQAGGLYPRKKKFKSPEAFRADAEKRLQAEQSRADRDLARLRAGRLTEIEARLVKNALRMKSSSMAMTKINQLLVSSIMHSRMEQEITGIALSRLESVEKRMIDSLRYRGKR